MQQLKLNNTLTVLPTSRAIRDYRQNLKSNNQLISKYISIGDFFQRVVLDKKNRKFLDKNLKIIFLKTAIQNIDITQLGFSKDFTTFLKQSEYIFRFFQELANEYINIDDLIQYDTYAIYSDHIDILKQIYKNYTELLEEHHYCDTIFLPEDYEINEDYVEQFHSIKLYLEGYLTKFEFKILQDISQLIKLDIVISFNEFNKKNLTLFKEYDFSEVLEINHTYTIRLFQDKLTIENKQKNRYQTQDIVISPIPSKIEQIGFIKYHITKMCEQGIEPSKIAVVVPNEKISFMLSLFDDEHYFNFAMGKDIQNNKIVKVVKLINKILVDKEPKDEEKLKYLHIDNEIFSKLFQENWNSKITKELFEKILDYLFSFENDEDVLEKLEQIRISLDILIFSNITETSNIQITLKEFMKLFSTELNAITIDDVSGGKITVLGILETRAVEFDGVIVVDFNDDKIPKISVKDKFISSSLKQNVGLPSIEDRENLQRYYYKRLFDKASNIAICYIDDESSVMSRFIVQLFSEYKKYIDKKDFSVILYQKQNLIPFYKEMILDIDLSKQTWSATRLKTYLQCKRAYYFNYIANIKDHDISIKPQAYEIGNIIHKCLEKGAKNDSLTSGFISGFFSTFQKNNPYLVLELELWKKRLEKVIEFQKQREQKGVKIVDVEVPFNFNYNGIKLTGTIDRIDKNSENKYEIIDYKTSTSLKVDTSKTYEKSIDFQLEFYYLSQQDKMIDKVSYYSLSDNKILDEVMLDEKVKLLDLHLKALKTQKVNFTCTDDVSVCKFCTYQTICQRDI